MTYKELLAIAATLLTYIGFIPYIRSILLGKIKPHIFSWIIWGAGTLNGNSPSLSP
ncbi:TDP-N-acetylfucosamine:lipid II N-acetylfucosaminyltransferase [Paenibacillus sp. J5C_2022]|uniref:TDP-N-acetylfucosamine:lipid II N-acetylfucosaminyltransferase n=1 Tax=Paenibacillus sp. J5C2022 TaxID=2977129 RepID=UPI0021D0609B|nr:TDP-N-acetylfucosamine:lipid II N-acetylfucosaminyltransferase [Paenibacillus sp. J5C2022]MCU6711451.1 TDP-N-acetylfucosamine:lipid II N-acetylfucosaminyltransferase [Paenibacillus sp. J5C2022]